MFRIHAIDKNARAGILTTKTSEVRTPAFMPVNTKGTAKFITARDLVEMDVQALICNSLILYLKPGLDIVGDVHEFMGFSRTIFTDCGAFQMLRESFFEGYTEKGIRFRDPFSGKKILLTPEEVMRIETSLNCDVAMALDNLPDHKVLTRKDIEKAVEMTVKWHTISKRVHDDFWSRKKKKQLLFGIGQGGLVPELRQDCLRELVKMGFDGYALGGLCIGESKEAMNEMVKVSKEIIPEDKPVYLMGVGSPEDILLSIREGVDIFDSIYPTQLARHNTIFTWQGYLKIGHMKYANDDGPLEPECDCWVCRNHSRKFIRHLSKVNEPTSKILKSYHNLYFLQALVRKCRQEIMKGSFDAFSRDMLKRYGVEK